jgi:predicted membrane channel-forming protein YqfA (hemolysin III family)
MKLELEMYLSFFVIIASFGVFLLFQNNFFLSVIGAILSAIGVSVLLLGFLIYTRTDPKDAKKKVRK